MDVRWRIELFGGLRVVGGDRTVTRFRTRKAGTLLAYLAITCCGDGRTLRWPRLPSREFLVELFWPEGDPSAGRNNLSRELHALRRELEPTGVPAGSVLVADRATVGLNSAAVSTDVGAFTAALRSAARAKSDPERTRLLATAVTLYGGLLLPEHCDAWVLEERERLAEAYFAALHHLLGLLEQAGSLDRALAYARRGTAADPLREEAHRDLIRLLAAAGQPAAALAQYREMQRLLRRELGATPTEATRSLAREIERRVDADRRAPTDERRPTSADRPPTIDGPEPRTGYGTPSASLEVPGARRLVTLLVAGWSVDGAGTKSLLPEDEVEVLGRLLPAITRHIAGYEGVIHHRFETGLVAVFGSLQAHEDDPERAICSALEIREAARDLGWSVTVGIATGAVYIGSIGSEAPPETLVVGPTVHLAARLREQAPAGQIVVAAATHRQTRGAFTFAPFVPNTPGAPVAAYVVTGAVSRPVKPRGMDGRRAALIGRDEELVRLQGLLRDALSGRGRVVSVIGEAGVGKSRLVSELKLAAPSSKLQVPGWEGSLLGAWSLEPGAVAEPLWIEGRCSQLGMTARYSLFVDLLRQYFAWRPEEEEAKRARDLVAAMRQLVEEGSLAEEQLAEIGPALGHVLSLRFGTDWDEPLRNAPPEQVRYRTLMAARDFIVAMARSRPVVLVCEDLHWADRLSLDLVALLMEALAEETDAPGLPLMLLCVYRPEREHPSSRLAALATSKCGGRATELRLRELSPSQSRCLLAALLGVESLPAALEARILDQARGNPFFIEEVVHSLMDHPSFAGVPDVSQREGAVGEAPDGRELPVVPETVQSVILGRVDRLPDDLKRILQVASVIGRYFPRRLLEAVLGSQPFAGSKPQGDSPGTPLEPALWSLEEQGFVYQERVVAEEEYAFRHVLTQEAIYASLAKRLRARLHREVAEAMEALYAGSLAAHCERLAHHYEQAFLLAPRRDGPSSRDGGDVSEKAMEYLLMAGEKARLGYLDEAAIDYFQRALARLDEAGVEPSSRARFDALRGLGHAYATAANLAAAEDHYDQAFSEGRKVGVPPEELARLMWRLSDVRCWRDPGHDTMPGAVEGLALLGQETETLGAALMLGHIALSHNDRGEREAYREIMGRIAQLLPRLPYAEELGILYHDMVGLANGEKDLVRAARWLDEYRQRADAHFDARALADCCFLEGQIYRWMGDLPRAIPCYQESVARYARIGDARHRLWSLHFLARAHLSQGNLVEAEACSLQAVEAAEEMGCQHDLAEYLNYLGIIRICLGAWNDAREAFRKSDRINRERGDRCGRELGAYLLGRMALARGRRCTARRLFQAALAATEGARPAVLSALEEVWPEGETFACFCRRLREARPEAVSASLTHWFLEPVEPAGRWADSEKRSLLTFGDTFSEGLVPNWTWLDPVGDCRLTVKQGLEIKIPNGRNLWRIFLGAPRLLRSVGRQSDGSADFSAPVGTYFAIQTICAPGSPDRPSIGGLLIWKDKGNYLRLDRGSGGEQEVSFQGCFDDGDRIIGRGRLPSPRAYLRLERIGTRVSAFCSADGRRWFTVGQTDFPAPDPVEVGLLAIGDIDRAVYPGAHTCGTAVRFERFDLWQDASGHLR